MPKIIIERDLPHSFNWKKDYEPFRKVFDPSFWAVAFSNRDLAYHSLMKQTSFYKKERIHTMWRNGVLCCGVRGHETYKVLNSTFESLTQSLWGRFVSSKVYKWMRDVPYIRKKQSNRVYLSASQNGQVGYLEFLSTKDAETYKKLRGNLFGKTALIAVNLDVPMDILEQEIKTTLGELQRNRDTLSRGYIVNENKVQNWARGLACWDLIQNGFELDELRKLLPPLWGCTAGDTGRNQVNRAYKEVKEMINQHKWTALCGDPIFVRNIQC